MSDTVTRTPRVGNELGEGNRLRRGPRQWGDFEEEHGAADGGVRSNAFYYVWVTMARSVLLPGEDAAGVPVRWWRSSRVSSCATRLNSP